MDYAAAVRGAPDALTHDPEMIEQWGWELRRRWDALEEARREAILTAIRTYGEVEVAEGASEDAEEAIRFLVREEEPGFDAPSPGRESQEGAPE